MDTQVNVVIDRAIYSLQSQGGISRLWNELTPRLRTVMPDATFDDTAKPDVFLSTYYAPAPAGVKSIAFVYDHIAERYPAIGRHHPDCVDKHRAIAEASAVVAISHAVAADTLRFTGRKAVAAPCGGGEVMSRPQPSAVVEFCHRYTLDKPYIMTVGRRGLYKNVEALYQAWELWGQDAVILCVGGEDSLPQDQAFDRAYPGVRRQVALSDVDLACAYAGALALVYPSLVEGFGLPVVEAMACGCPVVGDNRVLAQVAGEAGFYANVTRPRQIAAALSLTLDPALRLERVLAGLQRAKMFTWAAMAETVAGVIRQVAA